jgi:hypothetical protein
MSPHKVVYIEACKKWWTVGSVCDKKRHLKRNVPTEEKVQGIYAWFKFSPCKSLRLFIRKNSVSLGSAFTATQLILFFLYKIMVVHDLNNHIM